YLWGRKIKKIDLVILSHEHEDHWNGLSSLIERFSVKSAFSQYHFFASYTGKKILSSLDNKGIDTAALSYGEALSGFEPAVVKILNPLSFASDMTAANDNSCVLKIDYCGRSLLLCADIQEKGIESILLKPSEIRSNIIQIPHHGSLINNLEAFVNTVRPMYAFINSSDGIVSNKTIEILQNHNVITLQSHKAGAVTFTIDKDGITCTTFGK
ncbi:MAG TPA: ComEC/Rec2 family competence protein, partial [Candidatus Wunengus sp. YC60]|uniref:ComEC/Rec2 family competence protein n=1 Tax=Candidatus Wunengus sp. YC60 TaxID=3367697 RepID=UPI0040277C50